MKVLIVFGALILGLSGCKSRSVLPDVEEVKVSREAPGQGCTELGKISGTTPSTRSKPEDALADLKREAANKGANYVVIKEYSSYGTAVTGIAYECR